MRSDAVKTGTQQAPHRSLFNALGMTKEEMDRPLVGDRKSVVQGKSVGQGVDLGGQPGAGKTGLQRNLMVENS